MMRSMQRSEVTRVAKAAALGLALGSVLALLARSGRART